MFYHVNLACYQCTHGSSIKIITSLRPESEGIHSQLYNREHTLSFDDVVSQLLSEESHLQEMKCGDKRS